MPEKFPDIPGHRIIKEEGKGSAGKVFRGRSDKNGKLVAIKQISRSLTSHESFLGHLKKNTERLREVRHPNVARSLSVGRIGDRYYQLNEFVDGETLQDLIRQQGRLSDEEAHRYIHQAARGLQAAAAARVIHQDLKPSNILISDEGEARVVDFSLRFHRYVKGLPPEQVYELMEFPLYMPPEERDNQELSVQSNIFSLGAIYHHLICGSPLLNSDGDRPEQEEKPDTTELSDHTRKIIDRMTRDEPIDRYQDYDELIEALEKPFRPKADYADIAIYAGVVVAILLTFAFFLFGSKDGGTVTIDDGDLEELIKVGKGQAEPTGPEGQFKAAETFFFQNPNSAAEALRKYQKVISKYPGTPWAFNAHDRINSINDKQLQSQNERWRQLEREIERLEKQEHYSDVAAVLGNFRYDPSANGWKKKIDRMKEKTQQAEKASYRVLRGRVAALAATGNISKARQELVFVQKHYSSSRLIENAKTEIMVLERQRTMPPAVKEVSYELNAASEIENFRLFARQLKKELIQFRYLQAEHLCRLAVKKFKEKDYLEYANACTEAIIDDEAFVRLLFKRIREDQTGRIPLITALDNRKLEVQWVDWGGVTGLGRNVKRPWKDFPLDEIFRMLDKCILRRKGEEQMAMGRFCFLRGMARQMGQKFQLAEVFEPSLKEKIRSFKCSSRVKSILEEGN